jgi:hypothetical protein
MKGDGRDRVKPRLSGRYAAFVAMVTVPLLAKIPSPSRKHAACTNVPPTWKYLLLDHDSAGKLTLIPSAPFGHLAARKYWSRMTFPLRPAVTESPRSIMRLALTAWQEAGRVRRNRDSVTDIGVSSGNKNSLIDAFAFVASLFHHFRLQPVRAL